MPDILAIVSKAVFDKEARSLGAGATWPTTAYTSSHKALAGLATGGALFLVTVRPDSVLWLVGILEAPTAATGAWRAPANTVPITDVTAAIPAFAFASGKGLVRDAKLAMALQTPRELSAETAALLRSLATGEQPAPAAKAAAATKPSAAAGSSDAAPASNDAPARHPAVPDSATWDAITETWNAGASDADGARQGTWRTWRADGTLRGECTYVDHDVHGTNRRFHPDGSVASEGTWGHGVLLDSVFFAGPATSDEPAILEGGAEVVRAEYVAALHGRANATIRYLDAQGRERDPLGVLAPARPAGVPATARWFSAEDFGAPDGTRGGWVDGAIERGTGDKLGTWRWWSTAGQLLRTELYTDAGKAIGTITPESDDVQRALAAFLADPKDGKFALVRAWSPELHARLRRELPDHPPEVLRAYVYALTDQVQGRRQWRRIVELVDDWEARAPGASDAFAWYLLGEGARAAYQLYDDERLARWWKRFDAIAKPDPYPNDGNGWNRLAMATDRKKGEQRTRIVARLAGKDRTAIAATAKAIAAPKTAAALDDAELEQFAQLTLGAPHCTVQLRDRASGEVWFSDEELRTHYWNGRAFAPSSLAIERAPRTYLRYIAQATACDERALVVAGKHDYTLLQRYGRHVLRHAARYSAETSAAEVEPAVWFRAPSPAAAQRVVQLVLASQPAAAKRVDPWFEKSQGVIMRCYTSTDASDLGVHDTALVGEDAVIERFPSHAAAVRAFERRELDVFRAGAQLLRIYRVKPAR